MIYFLYNNDHIGVSQEYPYFMHHTYNLLVPNRLDQVSPNAV